MTKQNDQKTEVQTNESPGEEAGPVGRQYYIEMAQQRNARVMLANTIETYVLADLVRAADAAIKNARAKLLISIKMEDFARAMEDYYSSVLLISETISRLFALYGGSYREPKGMKAARRNKNLRPAQVKAIYDEVMELVNRRAAEFAAENAADESEIEIAEGDVDEGEAEAGRKKAKAA